MIVAIHQPNYLPYLGFFHKMLRSDVFVVYDVAQFSKNDFHNRNRIKTRRGPQWLTVPVQKTSGKPILDVLIDNSKPWGRKHVLALRANYARAIWFEEGFSGVSEILRRSWTKLADLNLELVELFRSALDISAKIVLSSKLNMPMNLSPTEKIIWMVRKTGGTAYLSGAGGRDYLDESMFTDIRLRYNDFHHPEYPQPFGPFAADLSAIDALFNLGPHNVRELLVAGSPR